MSRRKVADEGWRRQEALGKDVRRDMFGAQENGGGNARRMPWSVRWIAALAAVCIVAVVCELWRLQAGLFALFLVPLLLASLGMSLIMAVYWREWRALPLSLVFAMLSARGGIEVAVGCGAIPAEGGFGLFAEVLLWASLPVAFGAIAGLWRIFENQALFLRTQRNLLDHEARYRHLIENATDAFYAADPDGRLTLVNAAAARLFGRRSSDLTALNVFDLVPADATRTIREGLDMMRTRDIKAFYHEFPIVRRDGSERWVGQNLQVLRDGRQVRGFQAVLRDITERHEAQEALRQSETRLRMLFETMSEGVLQMRADGRIHFSNPAAERILGVPRQDIESRHCADPAWEFVRPDGSPMPIEEWVGYKAYRTRTSALTPVTGLRRSDGSVCWLNASAEPILGKDRQFEGVVVTFGDISKTKVAEESLRVIEFALDSALEHVFLMTLDGQVVYANKSALRTLEYTLEELGKRTLLSCATDVTPEDWAETVRRARAGEWPTFESHYTTRSGRVYPVSTSISYVAFDGKEYLFAFAHDISREAELELQLRHAQKMEAIGTLAGGIAHDFNNILSGVLGYAELALQDTPADSPVRPFIQEVMAGGHRAADLVRQILMFSRRGEQKRQPLSLAPIVKESLKLLRGSLPATIDIRESVDSACGPVSADPSQVHQVMMNLCTNAYHAMRETGGVLNVTLAEVEAGAEWTSAELSLAPGRYAQLTVEDTGCGMNPETRRRIFEPFFTTKPQGEGTGLGLATVHGIVKSHKGGIRVASEVGKGTRFDVLFPLCRLDAEAPHPAAEPGELPRGSEAILVVDDEEPVARSTATWLQRLGYRVETAGNGEEALALVEADSSRFDLVITDQTMPRLTGFEMARRIRRVRPGMRVILCTGFTPSVSGADAAGVGIRELIAKPFDLREMARTVRTVLDS